MNKNGYTVIELLISITIFGIIVTAVFVILDRSNTSFRINSTYVDLRQNLRTAIDSITGDLSHAGNKGYTQDDPFSNWYFATKDAGFLQASFHTIQYTMDENNDGKVNGTGENFTISLEPGSDTDTNGIADTDTAALVQTIPDGTFQVIMNNIEGVGFAYAFDSNNDGELDYNDANANGSLDAGEETIWAFDSDSDQRLDMKIDPTGATASVALTPTVRISDIRAVRIWLLARAVRSQRWTNDTSSYFIGNQTVTPGGDNFKREIVSATVMCRNMMLQ